MSGICLRSEALPGCACDMLLSSRWFFNEPVAVCVAPLRWSVRYRTLDEVSGFAGSGGHDPAQGRLVRQG
jgi:hypothetical protein